MYSCQYHPYFAHSIYRITSYQQVYIKLKPMIFMKMLGPSLPREAHRKPCSWILCFLIRVFHEQIWFTVIQTGINWTGINWTGIIKTGKLVRLRSFGVGPIRLKHHLDCLKLDQEFNQTIAFWTRSAKKLTRSLYDTV